MVQAVYCPPAPLACLPVVAFVSQTTTTTTSNDRREMALELVTGEYMNYLLDNGWHIEQNGRLVPPDMVIEGQYQVIPKNEVCILELIRLHE